jgi:hypothetical protein
MTLFAPKLYVPYAGMNDERYIIYPIVDYGITSGGLPHHTIYCISIPSNELKYCGFATIPFAACDGKLPSYTSSDYKELGHVSSIVQHYAIKTVFTKPYKG